MRAPHRARNDALLAAATAVLSTALALAAGGAERMGAAGWALLLGSVVPLVWRRRAPVPVLLAMVPLLALYHGTDNLHTAPMPQTWIVLYTVAVTGRPLRTLVVGIGVTSVMVTVVLALSTHDGLELLRISGWIVAVLFCGVDVRIYRQYVASVLERAERAERTREEEAARRVAEERLRIARDLHDLLAHSITLIGVQTSVASHILTVDPERLDRQAVAASLDDIAETCREARAELRTTLQVLRGSGQEGGGADPDGPLPDLAALPGLVRAAEAAGARVDLDVGVPAGRLAPALGAAAYRIVQESLTNAVRHAGAGVRIRVVVEPAAGALRVTVTDDGTGPVDDGSAPGFGIVGMRERARSTGGTLTAGPRPDGGFEVSALLPFPPPPPGNQPDGPPTYTHDHAPEREAETTS
ncbi:MULTISPECIES: sensor histidine kinase [unclassified Streptomyces]|uniref:sensor histidine kinase n=1 Tax=unclassified Streptomyces TaxID=2593676 RepID=UPI002E28826E|nr:sensor histidine kinase [Streptomyces sp. NBC_01423]WSX95289.1 sensor histidine kinase [Streptomyces sp. NBC_00891]WSY09769.1 sensor histidine kinase [Streptomyces sp. NBC_00890]WSZ11390.1 sensor histidine kinase [Streptomyces sp. NBC_00869]WSZ27623.1 sensor histidine kinase [Streptomyces sp. NBC_00870]